MKLTKIEEGYYKGHYVSEIGVIYSEEYARKKFPQEFDKPVKKKASAKKAVKKSTKRK